MVNLFMKKLILFLFIIFLIVGCRNTDSITFKREFESLNSNKSYVSVDIPSDNPFIYITDSELVNKIENKEDLVVLFGYSKSNDTRSILSNLIKASNELGIEKIYYLDILNIRNQLELGENNEVITKEEGSEYYKKILELLDGHLEDYIVNGNIVGTRIYAPNILIIKNKKIEDIINGKSYLESEDEKEKESYSMIYEYLKKYNNNSCDMNEAC